MSSIEYPPFWNRIDDYLRAIRRRSDLSQLQLSLATKISSATISRLESGQFRNPRLNTLATILTATGYSLLVCDFDNNPIQPLPSSATVFRDLAGRRLPAHLDAERVNRDDPFRPWWMPVRGDYTYLRDRRIRDAVRRDWNVSDRPG